MQSTDSLQLLFYRHREVKWTTQRKVECQLVQTRVWRLEFEQTSVTLDIVSI